MKVVIAPDRHTYTPSHTPSYTRAHVEILGIESKANALWLHCEIGADDCGRLLIGATE